ncbi:hypothetical protein M569_13967 [Genlisea aurea]|uniref:Uncharacterized protein n=1 Tax=Genlisea aurea TaxID=192259 RepID=S8C2G3_9LAMI|nr:hypothetical protein M569_13967 [Genlisea aurea]
MDSSSFSEAYSRSALNPDQIVPLDFSSVRVVPESHSWDPVPLLEETVRGPHAPPVVDMAVGEGEAAVGRARRLFDLPTETKILAARPAAGATGYGAARISPFFEKRMWHERFTIMGSAVDHAKLLWPDDDDEHQLFW